MNADMVRLPRLREGVRLFKAKLVSAILKVTNMLCSLLFPFRPSPENDSALANSLAAAANGYGPPYVTHTLPLISEQERRNNRSSNSFCTRIRDTSASAVFFLNVNIVNFFQEFLPSHLVFAPLLPILLSFLQVRSSAANPSPFELPSVVFMVSLGCSVAYCLTLAAKFMFPGFASQFEILASIFGSFAVATLISLTLQLPWWSILFILTFIGAFFKLINKLHRAYGNILPHPRTMQQLLPLHNVASSH